MTKYKQFALLVIMLGWLTHSTLVNAQIYDNISFALPDSATTLQTVDVRAVDMDNDGNLDIILANEFQPNTLLVNNGFGLFSCAPDNTLPSSVHDSEDIAINDFNNDGYKDIAFVSEDDFTHEYYFNSDSLKFSLQYFLPSTSCNAVVTADFNKDGHNDLFLGNRGQNMILINNGTGEMINETPGRLPDIYDLTHDVITLDIDQDDDMDIFVANENTNHLLINEGGVFVEQSLNRFPQGLPIDTRKVIAGDIDNDGDQDLFLATVKFQIGKDPQNRLWLNDGNGFFTDVTFDQLPLIPDQTLDANFVDIDNDNDLDLIVSGVLLRPVKFYLNDGQGSFSDVTTNVLGTDDYFQDTLDALAIFSADYNNDGYMDLYIANRAAKDYLLIRNPDAVLDIGTNTNNIIDKKTKLRIAPNPANDFIQIISDQIIGPDFTFELFDVAGRLVLSGIPEVSSNQTQIRLPTQLTQGVHLLRIKTKDQTFTESIMIKRQ